MEAVNVKKFIKNNLYIQAYIAILIYFKYNLNKILMSNILVNTKEEYRNWT